MKIRPKNSIHISEGNIEIEVTCSVQNSLSEWYPSLLEPKKDIYHILKYYTPLVTMEVMFSQKIDIRWMKWSQWFHSLWLHCIRECMSFKNYTFIWYRMHALFFVFTLATRMLSLLSRQNWNQFRQHNRWRKVRTTGWMSLKLLSIKYVFNYLSKDIQTISITSEKKMTKIVPVQWLHGHHNTLGGCIRQRIGRVSLEWGSTHPYKFLQRKALSGAK